MTENNKKFAELVGICWHEQYENPNYAQKGEWQWLCKCGDYGCQETTNPDYAADSRLVLREMMKREDWPRFADIIGIWPRVSSVSDGALIRVGYILDTTGKTRDAAIEYIETSK